MIIQISVASKLDQQHMMDKLRQLNSAVNFTPDLREIIGNNNQLHLQSTGMPSAMRHTARCR